MSAKTNPEFAIEPFDESRLDAIVDLSLRAWAPVFESIEKAMDPEVFRAQHPDWRAQQRSAVIDACSDSQINVWVAAQGSVTAGFVALKLHADDRIGEIYMIAVDPAFQRRGIAKALTDHSLAWFAQAGMTTAMVSTGGDAGHAPARLTYESAGFKPFPIVQYFKKV